MTLSDTCFDNWAWEDFEMVRDEEGQPVSPELDESTSINWICATCHRLGQGVFQAYHHWPCDCPDPIVIVPHYPTRKAS